MKGYTNMSERFSDTQAFRDALDKWIEREPDDASDEDAVEGDDRDNADDRDEAECFDLVDDGVCS